MSAPPTGYDRDRLVSVRLITHRGSHARISTHPFPDDRTTFHFACWSAYCLRDDTMEWEDFRTSVSVDGTSYEFWPRTTKAATDAARLGVHDNPLFIGTVDHEWNGDDLND